MPQEDRRIIFDYSETYKAVYALCVKKEQRKLPPGAITAVTVDPDDSKKIYVKIHNHHDDTHSKHEYSSDFMAAALMLYCTSLGVPIAKRSRKSVEVKEDKVILRLMI